MLSSDQHTKGQWYTALVLYFMGIQSYKATWKWEKTKQGFEVDPMNWTQELSHKRPHNNQPCGPSSYHTYLHSWKADQFTIHYFQNLFEQYSTQGCQESPATGENRHLLV